MASKIFDEKGEKKELSEDEKIELIAKYKKLLDEGTITQEDFEAKRKICFNKTSTFFHRLLTIIFVVCKTPYFYLFILFQRFSRGT